MTRTPRRHGRSIRTSAVAPTVELPACRNYSSLSDTVLRRRSGRLPTVLIGACGAALVVTAGVALQDHSPSRHTAPYAAPAFVAPAATAAVPTASPIDHRSGAAKAPVVAAPSRAKFQVAGVRIVAHRAPSRPGVQRVAISPAVSPAHAASVEKAVLQNLITGLDSTPRLTTVRFRHRSATLERYISRGGVSMSALCMQWNSHTAYLLTAPSGREFATLQKDFRPT